MLRYRNIAIVIFMILITGCSGSMSVVSFEILEPATISYPENINNFGYLNRSPRSLNSFENVDLKSLNDTDLFILDTIFCTSLRRGFLEGIGNFKLDYLSNMLFLDARRADTLDRASYIKPEKVIEICNTFGLDAFISQDFYSVGFDEFVYLNFNENRYEKQYSLIQNCRWTVYVPGQSKPLDIFQYKDTLFFMNQETWPAKEYLSPTDMMRSGAYELGFLYGARNVPGWNEVGRVVYTGWEPELKKAAAFTNKGDWENACEIWNQNLNSGDNLIDAKLAGKSAHNLAVFYELEDDIATALEYSNLANSKWPSSRIEFYKGELETRLLNEQDILKQVRVR